MTRCFGWHLPATMLIPYADFLNHSDEGVTHYIVNRRFERDEKLMADQYIPKKRKINLEIFNEDKITLNEEDKKIFFHHYSERQKFILRHTDSVLQIYKRFDNFNSYIYNYFRIT